MEAREFEKLITISEGEHKYCSVCKQKVYQGQFYMNKNNIHIGRCVTCVPKNPIPEKKREENRSHLGPSKRRRTGGHGYSGGDGFTGIG